MKKNFVLFLVVVLVLGFAACSDKKQPAGSELSVRSSDANPVIRGVLTGKVVTLGHMAFVEVTNPADNLSLGSYKKMVLLDRDGSVTGLGQIENKRYKTGDEIFFVLCWPSGDMVPPTIDSLLDYRTLGLQINYSPNAGFVANPKK